MLCEATHGYRAGRANEDYSLRLHSRFAYGNSYDDQVGLPFFRNYRAGGNSSVRGYATGSLGPRSSIEQRESNGVVRTIGGETTGGNLLTKGGIELLVPTKFLGDGTYRASAFVDYGNVFNESCLDGNEQCMTEFRVDQLRGSYGLSLTWQLGPIPLAFVLAQPINEQTGDSFTSFNFGLGAAY